MDKLYTSLTVWKIRKVSWYWHQMNEFNSSTWFHIIPYYWKIVSWFLKFHFCYFSGYVAYEINAKNTMLRRNSMKFDPQLKFFSFGMIRQMKIGIRIRIIKIRILQRHKNSGGGFWIWWREFGEKVALLLSNWFGVPQWYITKTVNFQTGLLRMAISIRKRDIINWHYNMYHDWWKELRINER